MEKLTCLIVDDEELARVLLQNYASRLPHLEVVATCANPLTAIEILQSEDIDILFLDIQMPEITGIELLKSMVKQYKVILTTAYKDYAIEGYQLNVIDYLLKPFGFDRFLQAVNKAIHLLKLEQKGHVSIKKKNTPEKKIAEKHILIKSEHKVYRIHYDDILYVQSMREYVSFHLKGKKILSLGSLKNTEANLPSHLFLRIHKSYIIAINKVEALEGNMVHIAGETLPIGASYKDIALKTIFK